MKLDIEKTIKGIDINGIKQCILTVLFGLLFIIMFGGFLLLMILGGF